METFLLLSPFLSNATNSTATCYIPSTISIRLYEASSKSKKACNKVVLYATTTYRLQITVNPSR